MFSLYYVSITLSPDILVILGVLHPQNRTRLNLGSTVLGLVLASLISDVFLWKNYVSPNPMFAFRNEQ
jgi:hypothetical protein